MGHQHNHSHNHNENKRALMISFFLIVIFMVVEVIGGILTNSLALISDAGHMFSDAFALGLSLFAIKLGERKATSKKTFGYRRFEMIAASINGITLIGISLYIFVEAFRRFTNPFHVESLGMLTISTVGLIINIVVAWILMSGDKDENLNIRSAFLHVIGDLLGSLGAIIAALLIYFFDWGIADPIASIVVAILVLISGWRVTKESFHILMEGVPFNIEIESVKDSLLKIPHVLDVHDLHIWSLTSGVPMLICHLTIDEMGDHDEILRLAQNILHDQYEIEHSTLQVEKEVNGCPSPHGVCN
jgi:cobalt-zinc-cadmium efflux system protein